MLGKVDQAVALPPDGRKPRPRVDDRRHAKHRIDGLLPAAEPWRRRAAVQAAFSGAVFSAVQQDIGQAMAHLARRCERPAVISIPPHGSAPAKHPVHRAGHADNQASDPSPERSLIISLDDQMEVIVLHTEVEQAEGIVGRSGECALNQGKHPLGAQAADGLRRAKRHVYRLRGDVRRPGDVCHAGAPTESRLASGSCTRATPGARSGKGQLLQATRHLD